MKFLFDITAWERHWRFIIEQMASTIHQREDRHFKTHQTHQQQISDVELHKWKQRIIRFVTCNNIAIYTYDLKLRKLELLSQIIIHIWKYQ